jgi:hypothetical protein
MHHCLGLCAVLRASPGPISPHSHERSYVKVVKNNSLGPGGCLARAAGCLLGICSQGSCCCSHKMKFAQNPAAAPYAYHLVAGLRVALVVWAWILAI